MNSIFTRQQIKEIDKFTCQQQNISSLELMDRACKAIFDWLIVQYPDINDRRVVVFAGTGGNGGDALGVASALSLIGVKVEVYQYNSGEHHFTPDNIAMQERVKSRGISIHLNDYDVKPLYDNDIALDGMLGTGFIGSLEQQLTSVISSFPQVVSIDIPSGMYDNFSVVNGEGIVHATHTLAIQLEKLAYFLPENAPYIGELHYLNIGLDTSCFDEDDVEYYVMEEKDVFVHDTPRPKVCHKNTFGHVVSITGSKGMMGACALSCKAALRSGAGLVTALVPSDQGPIIQTAVPEAMQKDREDYRDFLDWDKEKPYTLVIGSGLASEPKIYDITKYAIGFAATNCKPIVVDASSINSMPYILDEYVENCAGKLIITPHTGEFQRNFGELGDCHTDRLKEALRLARQYECVFVLKDFRTAVISSKGVIFCPWGNPGMATAGSGDVLAGVIAGVVAAANSTDIMTICKAVALHSKAGDKAAESISERALIASDIIDALKQTY